MRIGRDHIASTVYTIVFAYLGASLPLVLLLSISDRSILDSLASGEVAEEVARTLVGSIGLVLAIPVTTAIGAWVVRSSRLGRSDGGRPAPDGARRAVRRGRAREALTARGHASPTALHRAPRDPPQPVGSEFCSANAALRSLRVPMRCLRMLAAAPSALRSAMRS